jgi:hypothetical protein
MLGHALPNDKELDWLRISKTTEKYYLTYQHMHLKAPAMKEWSEALLQAYVNAGGTLPMPCETAPPESGPSSDLQGASKPKGPDWILPKLPAKEPSHPRRRAGEHPRRGPQRRPRKHNPGRRRPRAAA